MVFRIPTGWLSGKEGLPFRALLWVIDAFGWLYFLARDACQGLSAFATVYVDPAGYEGAPHPLRPPVLLGLRRGTAPPKDIEKVFPVAYSFRVVSKRARNARAAAWVYRWCPTPDLGDWRESVDVHLSRYLGGSSIPSHTMELLGADGRPLGETLNVLIVDQKAAGAPGERHLTYANAALGGDPLQLVDEIAVAALDPAKMIGEARRRAATARGLLRA